MLLKLAGVIGAGVLLTALSALPAGAATNTVTIGSPVTLTYRILVAVPVTVVCDPVAGTVQEIDVSVTVTEAVGNQVASGQGTDASISPQAPLLTCDGVTQNHLVVDLIPAAGSPPFRYGGAIIQAEFFISTSSGNESGSSPYTPVRLVK
jgi:hypothetical protein